MIDGVGLDGHAPHAHLLKLRPGHVTGLAHKSGDHEEGSDEMVRAKDGEGHGVVVQAAIIEGEGYRL